MDAPTVPRHEERILRDTRGLFMLWMGRDRFDRREREIAALPRVPWRGRLLYTIRCEGPFGKGPHAVNVPESLLWNLLDLGHFLCPYHR